MDPKFVFFRIEKNIAIVEMSNEKRNNALSYDLLFELKINSKK